MTAPVAPRATALERATRASQSAAPCISCGNRTAMSLHNQPVCGTCQREGVNSESAQAHKAQHATAVPYVNVPSASEPGKVYRVTDRCPCKGFQVRKTCSHLRIAAAERAIVRCYYCGTNESPDGIKACDYCASLLRDIAVQVRAETEAYLGRRFPAPVVVAAPSCDWPSFCGCVRCGRIYAFSDRQPLFCDDCAAANRVTSVAA